MLSSTYRLPYFLFMAATRSAWSTILILLPGELARSDTAAVGRPPTQKKASILPSFSALTDSAAPRRSRLRSLSLSMPAASIRRKAITSVALPGEPVDTRLPLRSANLLTPLPSTLTTCMRLGYRTMSVRTGTFWPLNLSSPLKASCAASLMTKPT
jgi:hypothetical protein